MNAISGAKNVTSAAIISPEEEFWGPIQKIREKHDKAFIRWMPHINLLYPFVPEREFQTACQMIEQLQLSSFTISFDSMGCFKHGKNATVFLKPTILEAKVGENPLLVLQKKLQSAFPHCDDLSTRSEEGFQAHLTIAQFPTAQVDKKIQELMKTWVPFTWHVNKLHLIARPPGSTGNEKFQIKKTVTLQALIESNLDNEWVDVSDASLNPNEWTAQEEVLDGWEEVPEENKVEDSVWTWEAQDGSIAIESGNNNNSVDNDWTNVQSEDWGAQTTDWGVPTADWGVPTTDWGVPTTDWGVPTTDWGVAEEAPIEAVPEEEDNTKYIAQSSLSDGFDLSLVNMGQHSYNELFVEAPPFEEKAKDTRRSAVYDYACYDEERTREVDPKLREKVLNQLCRVRPSDSKPEKKNRQEVSTRYWTKRTCNVCGKLVFEYNQKHARSDKYLPWKEMIHIYKHKFHIHNDAKSLEALLSLVMNVAKMHKKRRSVKTFELVLDWIKSDNWPMFEAFQTELNKRLNATDARKSYMVREKAAVMKKRQVNAIADKISKSKSTKGEFKVVDKTTISEHASDPFEE